MAACTGHGSGDVLLRSKLPAEIRKRLFDDGRIYLDGTCGRAHSQRREDRANLALQIGLGGAASS